MPSRWSRCERSEPRDHPARPAHRIEPVQLAIELFYLGLLGLASLAIAFVSVVVVAKLFKGQR